jgi:ribosomal protein S18 acetylase RimI-like enzyme
MPEIEIRQATSDDLESLSQFEHGYYTDYVWQMNLDLSTESVQSEFRRVRLPRRVFVCYPRDRKTIFEDFDQAEALLLARNDDIPVGYIKIVAEKEASVARVSDLVVTSSKRRQGIASGLMLAALDLVAYRQFRTLLIELQSKNDPGIQMSSKLGFNFCGFRDDYFPNHELAIFFSRFIR